MIFVGDLPAREFEGGNMGPAAYYSCNCGVCTSSYINPDTALETAVFHSIADRRAHFGPKHPGYCYEANTMTVS